ncbi:hypothetical protein ACTQWG_04990 [Blautia sp. HCP3S3_H10_1]|uniref:hypothetical protein n=1 Tax=unclassified Blautia TaxID=2648079 RepID=UPI003F903E82|nr:hypothetical protein [Clostridia bacterium]
MGGNNEKLIIDGNAVYELDMECVRRKKREQEAKNAKWKIEGAEGNITTDGQKQENT